MSNFVFSQNWSISNQSSLWSSSYSIESRDNPNNHPSMTFKFHGQSFRIIASITCWRSNEVDVTIDGVQGNPSSYCTYVNHDNNGDYQFLCYEKTFSTIGDHTVTLSNYDSSNGSYGWIEVDAIDIYPDETNGGQLLDAHSPTPTATPAVTPTPAPELCYDNSIVGIVGTFNGTIGSATQCRTYPVSGAQLGDFVQVSFDQDLSGVTMTGYVSSNGYVTVAFYNGTGSSVPLSGTVRIHVYRHTRG